MSPLIFLLWRRKLGDLFINSSFLLRLSLLCFVLPLPGSFARATRSNSVHQYFLNLITTTMGSTNPITVSLFWSMSGDTESTSVRIQKNTWFKSRVGHTEKSGEANCGFTFNTANCFHCLDRILVTLESHSHHNSLPSDQGMKLQASDKKKRSGERGREKELAIASWNLFRDTNKLEN